MTFSTKNGFIKNITCSTINVVRVCVKRRLHTAYARLSGCSGCSGAFRVFRVFRVFRDFRELRVFRDFRELRVFREFRVFGRVLLRPISTWAIVFFHLGQFYLGQVRHRPGPKLGG